MLFLLLYELESHFVFYESNSSRPEMSMFIFPPLSSSPVPSKHWVFLSSHLPLCSPRCHPPFCPFVHSFLEDTACTHTERRRAATSMSVITAIEKRGPAQNIYGLDRGARFSASRTILRWIRRWLSPVWRGIFCTPCTAIQPHGTIAKERRREA